jgi:hypothetical protein
MLKGSREGILKRIQPISIHGQISLDVQYVYPDDPDGQIQVARIGPEAVDPGLEPGDHIMVDFLLGTATQVRRTPQREGSS